MVRKQDQIYGCLLGAAAGDALGFCVEDLTLADIREKYGPGGIQGYDTVNGFATISSHTQLSMFTANGLLFGATRGATRGVMAPYVQYLEAAYRDWSKTQHYGSWKNRGKCYSWLCSLEELYSRRNPEPAVLYALERPHAGTIDEPVNRSRGPNGLARCAPIGLFLSPQETPPFEISLLGAESAALTHGDPLVLTDSGGLQEEAPALGKPVLVLRRETERPEAIAAGTAKLAGVETESIVALTQELLQGGEAYARMAHAVNPYGDGKACGRIADAIAWHFGVVEEKPWSFGE